MAETIGMWKLRISINGIKPGVFKIKKTMKGISYTQNMNCDCSKRGGCKI